MRHFNIEQLPVFTVKLSNTVSKICVLVFIQISNETYILLGLNTSACMDMKVVVLTNLDD